MSEKNRNNDIIDWNDAIRRLTSEDILIKVVDQVALICQQYQNDLSQQIENCDFDKMLRLAHTIKGTTASISAYRCSGAALELESAIKGDFSDSIIPLAQKLLCELSKLYEFISKPGWYYSFKVTSP